MSSGSVSSFNDEDYEVDENSDEEEQEEPGDYCKGTFVSQRAREACKFQVVLQFLSHFVHKDSDLNQNKLLILLLRRREVYSSLLCVAVNLAENFVDKVRAMVCRK